MTLQTYLMIKQAVYNIPGPSPIYSLPNMQSNTNSNVNNATAPVNNNITIPTNLGSLADWTEMINLAKKDNPDKAKVYDGLLEVFNAGVNSRNNS